MNIETLEKFKNREIKAKKIFYLKEINKPTSYEFIKKYHYLKDAKFFFVKSYGLFSKENDELLGCAVYSLPQGISTLKGWFSLPNTTKNIFELARLCVLPILNGTNATSFLLSNSIKEMKKENNKTKQEFKKKGLEMKEEDWICRAIITLACSTRHVGSIYQVCNFKYYGMTKKTKDFYRADGKINPRGKSGSMHGVYLPRDRKHRYAFILDDNLKVNYKEEEKPKIEDTTNKSCCGGEYVVYDNRFDEWYTCPLCTDKIKKLTEEQALNYSIGLIIEEEKDFQQLAFDFSD